MQFMNRVGSGQTIIRIQQVIDNGPTDWAAEFANHAKEENTLDNVADWAKEFEETQPQAGKEIAILNKIAFYHMLINNIFLLTF